MLQEPGRTVHSFAACLPAVYMRHIEPRAGDIVPVDRGALVLTTRSTALSWFGIYSAIAAVSVSCIFVQLMATNGVRLDLFGVINESDPIDFSGTGDDKRTAAHRRRRAAAE